MLDKMTPGHTVRSIAGLAPLHGVAQRPLRRIICGVEPRYAHEGPQCCLHLEQLLTGGCGLRAGTTRSRFQLLPKRLAQPAHIALKRRGCPSAVPRPVPPREE